MDEQEKIAITRAKKQIEEFREFYNESPEIVKEAFWYFTMTMFFVLA